MKICIVAPSQKYLSQAGVRIRYQRISSHLRSLGHDLIIEVIENIRDTNTFPNDIYIFSKCYDARAFILVRSLSRAGKLVGVDFFDDYFSQVADSRFVRMREWVRTMSDLIDFFMCSTPRIRKVISEYMPGRASHILNDPFGGFDVERVGQLVEQKLERTLLTRRLDVVWFGIGDNPHFSVGLNDLSAFSHALRRLQSRSYDVRLRILTNRRALTLQGLSMIGRLPTPHHLEEWTEKREAELLAESVVAFIPVNAQTFSIAKSLNRAVSTFSSGAQVLSCGYPLYKPLDPFVYADPSVFLADIERKAPALRAETLPKLVRLLSEWGDPDHEAKKLAAFLDQELGRKRALVRPVEDTPAVVGVIHGRRSSVDCHKFTQRIGHLSISTPLSSDNLNYDIRFVLAEDGRGFDVDFAETALRRLDLRATLEPHLKPVLTGTGRTVQRLSLSRITPHAYGAVGSIGPPESNLGRLVRYDATMATVRTALKTLFPKIELYTSELESPFLENCTTDIRNENQAVNNEA
jgi:hypothetical protein